VRSKKGWTQGRRRIRCAAFVAFTALCLSTACFGQHAAKSKAPTPQSPERSHKKEDSKTMDPKLFLEVPLNTNERNPCSPPPTDPSWRGIVIQAPSKVSFKRGAPVGETKAFAAIPVCGVYRVDVPFPPVKSNLMLFARDKKTNKIYSGPVIELDDSPFEPDPDSRPLSAEDVKGMSVSQYFNPNLADFVDLPEAPGVYEVHVMLREMRSNAVTIEIVETKAKAK
jgi:hypothetical protein